MYLLNDIAYLAGIIDGEGCICLHRSHASDNNRSAQYQLAVSFEMSEMETVKFISETFYKPIQIRKRKPPLKILYTIRWSSKSAFDILSLILPFMHGKQVQAQTAIECYKNTLRDNRYHSAPYTAVEIELREFYYHRLRLLKTQAASSLAQDSHTQRLIERCKEFSPKTLPEKTELEDLYNTPMGLQRMSKITGRPKDFLWRLMKKYEIPLRKVPQNFKHRLTIISK